MAQENIDVTVDLKDALSRPAGRAEEALEDLGDQAEKLAVQQAVAAAAAKKHARELNALRVAAAKANQVDQADMMSRIAANADAAAGNVAKVRKETDKHNRSLEVLGKVIKAYKVPAVLLGVTLLASAVSSLGAAGFAGVAGLSPLVGLLGVMPGLILTVLSAVGAVKLGMKGVGDAVKALAEGDPAKIAEAMSKLTVEGQVLALTVDRLARGPLKRIREATQSAIAPGFTAALHNLGPVLPIVRRGLTAVAGTIGDIAERSAAAMATPLFSGQLERVMRTSNRSLWIGAGAAGALATAGLGIADAFRPVQIAMFRSARGMAEYVAGAVEAGRKSGDLTEWFQQMWRLAQAVGGVLADLAVGLYNVGKQSDAMSGMLGGSIADMASDWRAWTSTVEGQNAIRAWFEDAMPVITAFGHLVRGLAVTFGSITGRADLAPLIEQINGELMPALDNLLNGVVSDLGPSLIDALTAFINWLSFLSYSPMVEVFATIASGALMLTQALNALPGPVKTLIALLFALKLAATLVSGSLGMIRKAGGPSLFAPIITGAKEGSRGIGFFNRAAGGAIGAVGGLRAAGGGLVAAMGGPWVIGIMAVVAAIGMFAAKQAKAKALADGFTQSLDAQTGALTEATDAWASQALLGAEGPWNMISFGASKDAMSAADELGLSMSEITAAAQGNDEALAAVNAQLDALDEKAGSLNMPGSDDWWIKANVDTVRSGIEAASEAADKGKANFDLVKRAQDEATQAAYIHAAASRGAADGMSKAQGEALGLTAAERGMKDVVRGATFELKEQAEAADDSYFAILRLNGLLDKKSSWISFRESMTDVTKQLREGFKPSLNENTAAGQQTFRMMEQIARSAADVQGFKKQQEALRESSRKIREMGRLAGITNAQKLDELVAEFIEVDRKAMAAREALRKAKQAADEVGRTNVDISITSNLGSIITDIDRVKNGLGDIIASQGQVTYTPPTSRKPGRRDGGPVWAGQPFTVGEVGPELFLSAGGAVEVIGLGGEQTKSFNEPGWVLPTEFYQAARAERPTVAAMAPAAGGGASSSSDYGPVPDVHNHFHGDGAPTEAEIEAATLRAWRKFDRERQERK